MSGICAFTGHRRIPEQDVVLILTGLDRLIEEQIANGCTHFRCGGAQGFDTVAALKVLEAKKKHPQIKLDLFLPCKDQSLGWSENAKRVYEMVISCADSVTYTAELYSRGCMHERNRRMIDGSSACIAYCRSSQGGTAYTLLYAKRQGVEVFNVVDA